MSFVANFFAVVFSSLENTSAGHCSWGVVQDFAVALPLQHSTATAAVGMGGQQTPNSHQAEQHVGLSSVCLQRRQCDKQPASALKCRVLPLGHGQAACHCWMWQGGLWGGLSDPRNFTNLCEALALPSGKIRRGVLGKQRGEEQDLVWQCLVWEKHVGSLSRSGDTAGPVEMVGAGVCWPGGALPGRVPRRGAGVCVQPLGQGSHH